MEIRAAPVNVLLIEDNPGDARLIIEYLSQIEDDRFVVSVADRLDTGKKFLDENPFDVILLDLTLPDSAGLATFDEIYKQTSVVPVIVLTGLDDKNIGIAAVKGGAQDYLLKSDATPSVLVRTIRHSIERASLEWQIVQSNLTLEERVKARTEELEAAMKRASTSESLAIIGQLSGGVAHDLRNPLGAIKNASYYLKRKYGGAGSAQENEDFLQWVGIIDKEVTAANDVISRFLSYGSNQELKLSEISINEIIHDALDSLAIRKDIRLSLMIDADMPLATGHAPQLVRVFQNLVNNALDALPSGGRLTIHARQEEDSIKTVVSDTGCGISPETLEGIFEPLYTTKPSGTGLGLAICREIVKKHNGSITVESEVGVGTSFTVRIPVRSRSFQD